MEIVEQTQSKLKLQKRPIVLFSIVGSIFVLMGVGSMVSGNLTTLSCNRIESKQSGCQLVKSGLLGTEKRTIPLNELQGAKVEVQRTGKNGGSTTYVVLILTNKGEEPLTISLRSRFDEKQASEINYFVANPGQKSLIVEQDSRLSEFIFGGFVAAFGFVFLLADASIIICTLDKTLGNFTLKRQSLFGTKFIQHQLQEIKDVELEFSKYERTKRTTRIAVVLVSGERVPFTYVYSNYGNKEKAVQCIREFLNLGV